jgi:hypothetical protein
MATVFFEKLRSFEPEPEPKGTKIFRRGKVLFNTGTLSLDHRDSYPLECKDKDRFPLCLGFV